jgi:dihydrofolate reductase
MPVIAIIVATAKHRVIGQGNDIPWYCPADLQYFKKTTLGAPVIMGRKTWDSLKIQPLPGRENIIITRDPAFTAKGCVIVNSIELALEHVAQVEKIFIIGGAMIYEQMLDHADELYVTEVDAEVGGDRYFPVIDQHQWCLDRAEKYSADDRNPYNMVFKRYIRER